MPPHDGARDAFLTGVGQELRTPLSLVAEPIENLFERRAELAPDLARQVSLARANVVRLARVVEAMLDLSPMEAETGAEADGSSVARRGVDSFLTELERAADVAWRRAALTAIQDGVVVYDENGLVLEINQAFTELLGYGLDDGPLAPPYPWWPTPEEDAAALAAVEHALERSEDGRGFAGEYLLYRRDRRPVWVWSAGGWIGGHKTGLTAAVQTFRGIDREKTAQDRRLAAAQVSADLASADDLDTVLAVAEHGFSLLFDGGTTVQLTVDSRLLLVSGGAVALPQDLSEAVRNGLAGQRNPDATSARPGILLAPASNTADCRAWIQFSRPRRIGPDEMIVADLLAQAFALAVDGVLAAEQAADHATHLEQAVESHRLIGQAVGILIERHRLLPNAAFQMLKASSHNRNLKLREVARRMIESGLEPDEA